MKARDVTEHQLATMMVGREGDAARRPRGGHGRHRDVRRQQSAAAQRARRRCLQGPVAQREGRRDSRACRCRGNGQAEVMEAIAGLRQVHDGEIVVANANIVPMSVPAAPRYRHRLDPRGPHRRRPGDRRERCENIVATRLKDRRYVRGGLLDLRAIRANAAKLIEQFSIRVNGPGVPVGTLSGGNMQKVVVARELSEQPKLLLVSQPTRGVDLGATQFIWKTIAAARDAGAAVLLSSADLGELLALSDRLLVFYRGRIVAAFHNREDLSPKRSVPTCSACPNNRPKRCEPAYDDRSDPSRPGAHRRRQHEAADPRLDHRPRSRPGVDRGGHRHDCHAADRLLRLQGAGRRADDAADCPPSARRAPSACGSTTSPS